MHNRCCNNQEELTVGPTQDDGGSSCKHGYDKMRGNLSFVVHANNHRKRHTHRKVSNDCDRGEAIFPLCKSDHTECGWALALDGQQTKKKSCFSFVFFFSLITTTKNNILFMTLGEEEGGRRIQRATRRISRYSHLFLHPPTLGALRGTKKKFKTMWMWPVWLNEFFVILFVLVC